MSIYTYPADVFDRPRHLLAALGSFWAETWQGRSQMESLTAAGCLVDRQSALDLLELIASLSRYTVPIYHRDQWRLLTFRQSAQGAGEALMARHDSSLAFDGRHRYDAPADAAAWAWAAPADLAEAPLIVNRLSEPSLVWSCGSDFLLQDGALIFREDPFADSRVATRAILEEGVETDREAALWLFRGGFDWQHAYRQFGYTLGLRMRSSRGARELLNAVLDALVGGCSRRQVEQALSAMTGVPLALEPAEVVERVARDRRHRVIVTDKNVYRFHPDATPLVAAGDTLRAGQPLTDALQLFDLRRGEVPAELKALPMGRGFLAACFYSDLIFENREVPLEVITDDPSGYTKIKFSLGGFPLDVERFFDELHARGVAESQIPLDDCDTQAAIQLPGSVCDGVDDQRLRLGTLAHRLDRRTNRVGEPSAANLPASINPLQFLIENVLRLNATLVRIKASLLGEEAIGLRHLAALQRVLPPHTAVIVLVEMTPASESVTVDRIQEAPSLLTAMEPQSDAVSAGMLRDRRPALREARGAWH